VSEAGRLEIGSIVRAHGIAGEVIVDLSTDRSERLAPGAEVHRDGRRLVVTSSRPHQHRWIVAFDGVADRDAAEALRGVLTADALDDPEALWVHEAIGAEVVTPDGVTHGRVVAVEANPAHDLLVLESGALVPVVFVVGWDGDRRLRIEPPDGLLDTV